MAFRNVKKHTVVVTIVGLISMY